MVATPGSDPGNRGSNPRSATRLLPCGAMVVTLGFEPRDEGPIPSRATSIERRRRGSARLASLHGLERPEGQVPRVRILPRYNTGSVAVVACMFRIHAARVRFPPSRPFVLYNFTTEAIMGTCRRCGESEPNVEFKTRIVNGKRYPRHLCCVCFNKYNVAVHRKSGALLRHRKSSTKKTTQKRAAGLLRVRFILADSRKNDKKRGFQNDLDKEFVANIIKIPCSYCGEKDERVSLDRIDNAKGHTKDNVVPACYKCNYIRRDMPYDAWLIVANGVRKAYKLGLFGQWTPFRRKT